MLPGTIVRRNPDYHEVLRAGNSHNSGKLCSVDLSYRIEASPGGAVMQDEKDPRLPSSKVWAAGGSAQILKCIGIGSLFLGGLGQTPSTENNASVS